MGSTMFPERTRPTPETSHPAGGDALGLDTLTAVTLAAVATAIMFQTIRIFVSYMVFVIDQSNRVELAVVVFGTFLMIGLGGLVIRFAGLPAALLIGMAGLVVPRGIVQFTDSPDARFILGGVAIVAWGWLMIALLGRFRAAVAAGLALGVGLDLAIRTAFMTVDLPWIPSAARHSVTIILLALAAVTALLLSRRIHLHPPAPRTALSLLVVGPAFALYHVAAGNFGFAQEHGNVGFPGAAAWLTLGALLGIAALVLAGWRGAAAMPDRRVLLGIAGFVLAAGLAMIWMDNLVAVVSIALTMAGLLALLGSAALGRPQPVDRPGDVWVTVCFTGGLLLQVGLLFLYYTYSGSPLFLGVTALIVIALAIPLGAPAFEQADRSRRYLAVGGAGVGVLLVLATAWHLVTFSEPVAGAPARDPMTIMNYNLQNGFDSDNRWHLERQAQTIEAQNPDVVVIQEISRG
jgi:hypothetical protein